ncbi:glycerate kinase type-2 family protein [Halodurantibacterium flavum]|uniref:Glycerate kinase n=1 Tax=Halodurantibacterium flavum TaxID=1382802 RepID=A0ABW4S4C3_9RHOB
MDISAARARAKGLFERAVAAADPARAVQADLGENPLPALAPGARREVIALGKAARAMAAAALPVAPGRCLIVTTDANADPLEGVDIRAAGHPVPDARGAAAANEVLARLADLRAGDQVLFLISGGGSALLPAPAEGLTLEDKATVNRLLLASGADIAEMNLVRQQLSRTKGGGLARAAAPAFVRALILSDVVGDDLRIVASGPTVAPLGDRTAARAALQSRGLWDRLPDAVRAHLISDGAPPVPAPAENRLIGSNILSVRAMAQDTDARVVHPLTGDVEEAAARIWQEAGPDVTFFGGETTVKLRGQGRGGRNQELALRVALRAEELGIAGPFVFLSGGTDGRDGPTDAAGGIVDHETLSRMRAAGVDPAHALAENDSYPALAAAGDLLMTGETGTNVADVQVMIRG